MPKREVQVKDQAGADCTPANLVLSNFGPGEFVLWIGREDTVGYIRDGERIEVVTKYIKAKVVMTPQMMKRTLETLQQQLKKYEEEFGLIDTSGPITPPMNELLH